MIDPDICEHNFVDGVCINCEMECEHWEIEDGRCLECGYNTAEDGEPPEENR